MAKNCSHFSAATIDGVCLTCERQSDASNRGPLVSYAGGRKVFVNGPTVAEQERENKVAFAEIKGGVEYVGSHRRQSLDVNRHFA